MTPAQVGWRALAAALSDLAAMGAEPGEAYLVLGLPAGFAEEQALELVRGAHELARRDGYRDRSAATSSRRPCSPCR